MIKQNELKLSPTVESVLSSLSKSSKVSAWDFVKEILQKHNEYGDNHARAIASGPEPEILEKKPAHDWLKKIETLFDRTLVPTLHGRIVILGLCRLDETLTKHLRGFVITLEKEVTEDFESLLLPEYAGTAKYKRDFIQILQNRSKLTSDKSTTRTKGFIVIANGGPGLQSLEKLCYRQNYNYCLTARYIQSAQSTAKDLIHALLSDLRGLAKKDTETIGELLPEGTGSKTSPPGNGVQLDKTSSTLLNSITETTPDSEIIKNLFSKWLAQLSTGKRLVIFIEWRNVPENITIETLKFKNFIQQLGKLPERTGIVMSGLPENITRQIPNFTTIELPPDLTLRHALPLINDTPEGPDLLNIVNEVGALAEAIALKGMHPPLVVGILGGWGSGKSFVLHLLKERLMDIRCEKIETDGKDNFPFIGHPYVINFDAWTFAKSDLWASLMQTILTELDNQIMIEKTLSEKLNIDPRNSNDIWRLLGQLSGKQKKRLLDSETGREALTLVTDIQTGATSGRLWDELKTLHDKAIKNLEKQETELRQKQQELSKERRNFENFIDKEIAEDARKIAWDPVWQQISEQVKKTLTAADSKTYEDFIKAFSLGDKYRLGWQNISLPVAAFMLFALVTGFAMDFDAPRAEFFSAISGFFIAATSPLLQAYNWLQTRHKQYNEHLTQAMKTKAVSRQQRIEEALAYAHEETPAANVVKLEKETQEITDKVQRLRDKVGISRHANLGEFIKERLESGFYENRLGLLHDIQNDIEELSESLLPSRALGAVDSEALSKLFPRGSPRLVLLIDDLDRCPPDKVVEVFEAAQLLVKTQLFVVVIAMDVRYVTRALENKYKGVLVHNGEPSGLDYIEKIIQIPYRVRTATGTAISGFLHAQMNIDKRVEDSGPVDVEQVEESAGELPTDINSEDVDNTQAKPPPTPRSELRVLPTDILEFTTDEHSLISTCCSAIYVSPRAMKRLVNVFKLLKIIWYRDGLAEGPQPEVKQAMLCLLVLAAGYPEVVRQLLSAIEAAYRSPSVSGSEKLCDFLKKECTERVKTAIYPPDWDGVSSALEDKQFFPDELSFSEFEETNLQLVNSFSFVGETDSEREASLKRGFYHPFNGRTEPKVDSSVENKKDRNPYIRRNSWKARP